MRNYLKVLKIGLIFFLLLINSTSKAFSMKDAILAVVNEEVITHNDLRDYLSAMYVQLQADGKSEEELASLMGSLESKGIQRLIEDKLIISEANNLGMVIKEEAITSRMDDIIGSYPTQQAFIDSLVVHGSTITDIRDKIREQMQVQNVIDMQVKSKIFVNPQEVTDYYKNNLNLFKKAEEVKVDSIAISYGKDKELAMLKAEEALSLVQKGNNFDEVAKEYSQIQSIGSITKGQMLESIENIVFNLDEGEISPLIETEVGIFIFKVTKNIPAQQAPLEEVKDEISKRILQNKFRARYLKWIEKLKDRAYVEIKD